MKKESLSSSPSSLPLVTLIGGSGFVGRRVALHLARRGWLVRVASRKAEGSQHPDLLVPGIESVYADITKPASVAKALEGASALVNLTGILSPTRRQSFDQVHFRGAQIIAEAARKNNISHLVHISAIGADKASPSSYARSKVAGEGAVLSVVPEAIILRPSIIFGHDDRFFNRFALMARFSPMLPLIGGGLTLFQPVFVDDVAQAIALALEGRARQGSIYELGGPERRSFSDLLAYIGTVTQKRRYLIPVPLPLATVMAFGLETLNALSLGYLPETFLITRDQIKLLRHDNIVSDGAESEGRTLEGLGIHPQPIASVVPHYLNARRSRA